MSVMKILPVNELMDVGSAIQNWDNFFVCLFLKNPLVLNILSQISYKTSLVFFKENDS